MEIEVKVLEIDVVQVRQQLAAAGCQFKGREFQRNYMYDYPDHRLYEQQDGSYIRLRQSHWLDSGRSEIRLTFKQTRSREQYKIAEETETTVGSFEQMASFLTHLGLIQTRLDEKLRESWVWPAESEQADAILFEIDEWAGLPPYLEVEASSETRVAEGLSLLGYRLEDSSAANLREVLSAYKIEASSLCFADFGRHIEI